MRKREIKKDIKRYIQGIVIAFIGFALSGCGQTGGLFLVESEAEYNEGHFMLPYRGDDNPVSSRTNNQPNGTNDLSNNEIAQ